MRLEVTRRAGLAVRAMAALAPLGTRAKAGDLAAALETTAGFVPQVVGPLVKAGWVRSIPGPTGGYALTDRAAHASVLDVLEAIDGPTDNGRCVVEDQACGGGDAPCALHEAWSLARAALMSQLSSQVAVPAAPAVDLLDTPSSPATPVTATPMTATPTTATRERESLADVVPATVS